jgi:hypothetical protein
MRPERCEKCGGELEFRVEGSVEGFFCKSCDWAVVTTHIPQIQLDETPYEVRVTNGDYHDERHVKAVAEASGVNFLAARNLLKETSPLVFKGEATQVAKIRRALETVGLTPDIRPPFPWS